MRFFYYCTLILCLDQLEAICSYNNLLLSKKKKMFHKSYSGADLDSFEVNLTNFGTD
jgi:hypothetical protein